MISKKLLSKVLNEPVCTLSGDLHLDSSSEYLIYYNNPNTSKSINVYKLLYKCKEWAAKKGILIKSDITGDCSIYTIANTYRGQFNRDVNIKTELEAVIHICEWILKTNETDT